MTQILSYPLLLKLGIGNFYNYYNSYTKRISFIVIPLMGPALFGLGFDPVWIGILIALVLQTSFITPPFGFSLFYLRGVIPKEVNTFDIYKGIIPFLLIQIALVIIVFIAPQLATFLPNLLFGWI